MLDIDHRQRRSFWFQSLRLVLEQQPREHSPNLDPPKRDNRNSSLHFDDWYGMVGLYSTFRELTATGDVVDPLQGLANASTYRHYGTIYAGLWMEDLQDGLWWYVERAPNAKNPQTQVVYGKDHMVQCGYLVGAGRLDSAILLASQRGIRTPKHFQSLVSMYPVHSDNNPCNLALPEMDTLPFVAGSEKPISRPGLSSRQGSS